MTIKRTFHVCFTLTFILSTFRIRAQNVYQLSFGRIRKVKRLILKKNYLNYMVNAVSNKIDK